MFDDANAPGQKLPLSSIDERGSLVSETASSEHKHGTRTQRRPNPKHPRPSQHRSTDMCSSGCYQALMNPAELMNMKQENMLPSLTVRKNCAQENVTVASGKQNKTCAATWPLLPPQWGGDCPSSVKHHPPHTSGEGKLTQTGALSHSLQRLLK